MDKLSLTARERLRADLGRYYAYLNPRTRRRRLRIILKTEGIWAISVFRFGQYVYQEASPLARMFFKIPYELSAKLIGHIVGIHLAPRTNIGPGLYIGHYGGIWISPLATIGANCNIGQGVTIGTAGVNFAGAPVLGDRVWVGPNAVISGPSKVGDGAVVGANSLVVTNIPENGVAVGVPAKILAFTGSDNLIGPTEQTS
jgi:serine O-acetyltransferase